MNNLSFTSHLNQAAATESLLVMADTVSTFAGSLPQDFSAGNSMEPHQPAVQVKASETPHNDGSLFSTYQPANQSSITPVHQLLF